VVRIDVDAWRFLARGARDVELQRGRRVSLGEAVAILVWLAAASEQRSVPRG
jgi:hypothetical protein